ncbi:protein FAM50A isoform X1 [Alexandromys fortis]|uniref:protein FAM50A isoform X1 n=1 Tax=Alexandromys fortis TaxID=100897 RepID=UPI0021524443|nr:protein FAM50A isoform X1 [Microtus fortis]
MAQYKGAASEAGRAMHLMKKREKQREQMEQMKQRIAEENIMKSNIDKKFSAHYDAVEAELKSSTVGLVTLNDMKAKQEALVKEREKQLAKKEQSKELQLKLEKLREKERKKEAKRKISSLSFTLEEEEEGGEEEEEVAMYEEELEREEITTKKRKLGKNPDVDTSFLPDRDREEEENRLREELRQEWEAKQEKIKSEEIEITFSYWDGSGHRRTVKMKKGNTMQQFLQKALEILRKDFSELRSAGVEQLMYIKEDLIIPHVSPFNPESCTLFHRRVTILLCTLPGLVGTVVPAPTLQVGVWGVGDRDLEGSSSLPFPPSAPSITASTISSSPKHEERVVSDSSLAFSNMLGKAVVWPWDYCFSPPGPLFNFDVHDDVRLLSDATVEKDESHAGKVVLRSWYEKNKHIFPASRWEPYDPEKKWDKYTIR